MFGLCTHYSSNKHGFELLASKVVANHLSGNGADYLEGWITKGSGDGGIDFVGRLIVGSGLSGVKVVVLGQAKCESLTRPTSGVHIARTVARLKRGWIGAYVTTSFFSEALQKEILEDQYPLLKVDGLTLAREVLRLVESSGKSSLEKYLDDLDSEFKRAVSDRTPEDILIDR